LQTEFLVRLLLIPLIGTARYPVPPPPAMSRAASSRPSARRALLSLSLSKTREALRAGNLEEAVILSRQGSSEALKTGETQIATRFLNNLGGSYFALHRYREALQVYLDTRALAESTGDYSQAGKLDFNISSLYLQLGQMDAAVEAANRAMSRLTGPERAAQLPKLLIHLATLRAPQGRMPEALELFRKGIAAADRAGDLEMYAIGWSDLGEEYLKRDQLPQAERALLEAYRIRKLNHLRGLEDSYRNLGLLRLKQGDIESASALLDKAVGCSIHAGGMVPAWQIYYARGRVHLAQNRLRSALADLRIAVRLARTWRRAAPLDDATRVSAENSIQAVHSALIEAGNKLYFKTGDRSLARESFEVAEANRAASLRALLNEPANRRRKLPQEYWDTLRRLESAEVDVLRGQDSGAAARADQLRGLLVQLESRSGSRLDLDLPNVLDRTRARLSPGAAFLSFHLASPDSYLWAVSRERFALYRLPPASRIAAQLERFEKAVRAASPEMVSLGHQLYGTLFGPLDPVFRRKVQWLLALDSQLFELPFSALVEKSGPRGPIFLAERHAVQTTSGAGVLFSSIAVNPSIGPFLGVADPVYNTADPRWPNPSGSSSRLVSAPFLNFFAARAATRKAPDDLHLVRLAGSAREVAACASAWNSGQPPLLLEGIAASRERLQSALDCHPAVLHFATHFLHPVQRSRSGVIALSLTSSGQNEILSPIEIATWHLDGTVVSLSGCSSGSADALPGTGLTGLTRAWQAAGASAVVASLWPTPDDAGALFLSFYRHLRKAPKTGAAVALQHAQMDMLRSHSWRSSARYWGAYFVTGNQL
jgi:CHAT domain-containing protein